MGRDRSLDEFLADDERAGRDEGGTEGTAESDPDPESDPNPDPAPDSDSTPDPETETETGESGSTEPDVAGDPPDAAPDAPEGTTGAESGGADGSEGVETSAADCAAADDSDEPATDGPTALEVRPATSTLAWTVDDVDCAACGDPTDRRWRDGDRLVCADCKDW
jgi:hypothetical protein